MRQSIYVATLLLSCGLGVLSPNFALLAAQTSTTPSVSSAPSSPATSKEPAKEGSDTEEQRQMAAWLIESAQAAKDYVEGLDKGQYSQSWSKGDQIFQHTISQEEWTKALNDSRKRLGKVKSRTLKDQRPAWDPHGLPKGAYMVVEYNTSFENAPDSGELLTLRRGADGKWHVLTYQVN